MASAKALGLDAATGWGASLDCWAWVGGFREGGRCLGEKDEPVGKALVWDLGEPGTSPCFTTSSLCDLEQVSQCLWASVPLLDNGIPALPCLTGGCEEKSIKDDGDGPYEDLR